MRRWEFRRKEPAPALFGLSPARRPPPAPHSLGEGGPAGPGTSESVPSGERGDPAARGSPAWRGASPPPGLPFMACVRACGRGSETREDREPGRGRETGARDTETRERETYRRDTETRGICEAVRQRWTVTALHTERQKGQKAERNGDGERVSDNAEMEREGGEIEREGIGRGTKGERDRESNFRQESARISWEGQEPLRGRPRPRSPGSPTCTLQITARSDHTRFRRGHGPEEGTDLPEATEAAHGAPRGLHRQQWGSFFLWVEVGMASWEK